MAKQTVQMIEIDADLEGQRLDNFLISQLKGLPKSRIYRIIRKGEVRINGRRCKPQSRLAAGDVVRVPPIAHLPQRDAAIGHFEDLESLILYEDTQLLVLNKPAGMAVHGGSGQSVGVIESLRHARPEGDRLELVHRLDRGTSGCLMIAKRRHRLRVLQDALRNPGTISKQYIALVHGAWPADLAVVDQPILTVSKAGKERISKAHPDGRPALTRFERQGEGQGVSLVRAMPVTGRTHQIRVHARWARHPIVGDDRYGDELLDATLSPTRLMLHAARLEIPALDDFPALNVEAPLDATFQQEVDERIKK